MSDSINKNSSAKESPRLSPQLVTAPFYRNGFIYALLFIGLFALYLIFSPRVRLNGNPDITISITEAYIGDLSVRITMAVFLILLGTIAALLGFFHRMTIEKALVLIVLAGIVLRFGVMLYTPFFIHGHDIGNYDGHGHLAYIYRLLDSGQLPDTNRGQFYHPPLSHLASAAVIRLYVLITGISDLNTIFESARLVPCFFSCATLLVCRQLFKALDLSNPTSLIAMVVIAFHPTFFLLSSSINNDMAMVFFFLTAVLYTVRWYHDPSYKNILLLAVSIGCAMSAKFSGMLVAAYTAVIFLLGIIKQYHQGGNVAIVGQFSAFSAVCFPLGLWYQFRNLALFGQPLGYVMPLPKTSAMYIGDIPFGERFGSFNLLNVLQEPYCNPWTQHRLWEYTAKCALFGEFTFSNKQTPIGILLIVFSVLLIIISIASMVWFLFFDRRLKHKRTSRFTVLSLTGLWLVLMLSFVYFNIKYPFGCTMDFRYIVPTIVTGAVFLGLLFDKLYKSPRLSPLAGVLIAVLAAFAASAAAFYIV